MGTSRGAMILLVVVLSIVAAYPKYLLVDLENVAETVVDEPEYPIIYDYGGRRSSEEGDDEVDGDQEGGNGEDDDVDGDQEGGNGGDDGGENGGPDGGTNGGSGEPEPGTNEVTDRPEPVCKKKNERCRNKRECCDKTKCEGKKKLPKRCLSCKEKCKKKCKNDKKCKKMCKKVKNKKACKAKCTCKEKKKCKEKCKNGGGGGRSRSIQSGPTPPFIPGLSDMTCEEVMSLPQGIQDLKPKLEYTYRYSTLKLGFNTGEGGLILKDVIKIIMAQQGTFGPFVPQHQVLLDLLWYLDLNGDGVITDEEVGHRIDTFVEKIREKCTENQ